MQYKINGDRRTTGKLRTAYLLKKFFEDNELHYTEELAFFLEEEVDMYHWSRRLQDDDPRLNWTETENPAFPELTRITPFLMAKASKLNPLNDIFQDSSICLLWESSVFKSTFYEKVVKLVLFNWYVNPTSSTNYQTTLQFAETNPYLRGINKTLADNLPIFPYEDRVREIHERFLTEPNKESLVYKELLQANILLGIICYLNKDYVGTKLYFTRMLSISDATNVLHNPIKFILKELFSE